MDRGRNSHSYVWVLAAVVFILLLIIVLKPRTACRPPALATSAATYRTNISVKGCGPNTMCNGDCPGWQIDDKGVVTKCSVGGAPGKTLPASYTEQSIFAKNNCLACQELEPYFDGLLSDPANVTTITTTANKDGVAMFKDNIVSLGTVASSAPTLFIIQNGESLQLPITFSVTEQTMPGKNTYTMNASYLGNAMTRGLTEFYIKTDQDAPVMYNKLVVPISNIHRSYATLTQWVARNKKELLYVRHNKVINTTLIEWGPISCSVCELLPAGSPATRTVTPRRVTFGLSAGTFSHCTGPAMPIQQALTTCRDKGAACIGVQGDDAAGYQWCTGAFMPQPSAADRIACAACQSLKDDASFTPVAAVNANAANNMYYKILDPAVYKDIVATKSTTEQKIDVYVGLNAQTRIVDGLIFLSEPANPLTLRLNASLLLTERTPPVFLVSTAFFRIAYSQSKNKHNDVQQYYHALAIMNINPKSSVINYIKLTQEGEAPIVIKIEDAEITCDNTCV